MTASLHDAEVGIGLGDLIRDANARLVVAGDTNTANIVENIDLPFSARNRPADCEVRAVDDLAAFVGATCAKSEAQYASQQSSAIEVMLIH